VAESLAGIQSLSKHLHAISEHRCTVRSYQRASKTVDIKNRKTKTVMNRNSYKETMQVGDDIDTCSTSVTSRATHKLLHFRSISCNSFAANGLIFCCELQTTARSAYVSGRTGLGMLESDALAEMDAATVRFDDAGAEIDDGVEENDDEADMFASTCESVAQNT
jgi:hypothetical protein